MQALHLIVTDFNGYAQTRRCLAALRASTYRAFTVLVVDHGTTDETRLGLAAEFPDAVRIEASPQLWWSGATNLGIRAALERGATAVVLLNNDCYVGPATLGVLAAAATAHADAIIAPIQRDWRTGEVTAIAPRSRLLLGFPTTPGPRRLTPDIERNELLPVELVIGGRGVVIPSGVLERVGLLDEERLPHYGSDHDFYLRARSLGVPLYVATRAFVDVDSERTSLASQIGALDLRQFLRSLRSVRSHRNVRDVRALFRKHYPIRGLHLVGVMLYTGRYLLVYCVRRAAFVLFGRARA